MSIEVTIAWPENLAHAGQTQQPVESVLSNTLEMMLEMLVAAPESLAAVPVAALSDAEVWELAAAKMDAAQNRRLGALQAKGKAFGLSTSQRYELAALLHIYQLGQLRKSEALAEVAQRGLQRRPAA